MADIHILVDVCSIRDQAIHIIKTLTEHFFLKIYTCKKYYIKILTFLTVTKTEIQLRV